MRPRQWVKNLLVLMPLVLAHRFGDPARLRLALLATVAFCAAASIGYVLNDLMDLSADRLHPRKRFRPLASGQLPRSWALLALLFALALLIGLCWFLPLAAIEWLALYLVISIVYSVYLKKKLFVDVLVLAGLYTVRLLVGGTAATVELSPWLLAFSMFMFLSLAVLKRFSELQSSPDDVPPSPGDVCLAGRAYRRNDLPMLRAIGPTSGYLSVLVMAMYVQSDKVTQLYASPRWLWLICPLLLYWVTRLWFLAERKKIPDDPVAFAVTDRISYAVALLIFLLAFLATR